MEDLKQRIDELTALIEEFDLSEASLGGNGWKVAFRRSRAPEPSHSQADQTSTTASTFEEPQAPIAHAPAAAPVGMPVTSPMNGIYYGAPSPSSPPFVRVGETVSAGQVVGLIEAMKVFNEIVSPVSGTVDRIVAESGQLVEPGAPLLYIV